MADIWKLLATPVKTPTETLVAGTVDFYDPGTTGESNRKDVYTDAAGTIVAANPYTLDSDATAVLYGSGLYHVVIKDSSGNTEYDLDFITPDKEVYAFTPATLAELQAITGYPGATANLLARTTLGDGGGGTFYWDSSNLSTEVTADTQSGIYVAPDSDPTGASGAWVRQFSGAIDVRWYGAKGDGVTDDTTAIQAALNHAEFRSDVFVPEGVWICNDVNVTGITRFFGAGDSNSSVVGTVLKAASNGTRAVVYADNPRSVIERLCIDGGAGEGYNNTGLSTDGTATGNANFDLRFEKILIQNCNGNGTQPSGAQTKGSHLFAYNGNHLSLRHVTCNGTGTDNMALCHIEQSYVASVMECEFQTTDQIGLSIAAGGSTANTRVHGCWFESIANHSIQVDSAYQVDIRNNKFKSNAAGASHYAVNLTGTAILSLVERNTFQDVGAGGTVQVGTSVRWTRILDNTGLGFSGAPLSPVGFNDLGASETYIRGNAVGYASYSALYNGEEALGGGLINIDQDNTEVDINALNISASGANRTISKDGSGALILRSEGSEVAFRAGTHARIAKETGGVGDWSNGCLILCGAYLWVTAGTLYINTSAPANSTDGTIVGTQS